jgi:CYTH domain-containing protein
MTKNIVPDTEIPFEHERRFFPDMNALPFDFKGYPKESILQGYLEDGLRTRIRDTNDSEGHRYTQTRKIGEGVSRHEDEHEITKDAFNLMRRTARGSFLVKTRYFVTWDGIDIQLNIFHASLDGYVQIEVEFDTHEEAIAFIPPVWIGIEVTDNPAHGNYSLAKNGLPK